MAMKDQGTRLRDAVPRSSDPLVERARAIAALPGDQLVALLSEMLAREATPLPSAPAMPGASAFLAAIRSRLARAEREGRPGEILLDQSVLACPGLPWHVAVDGEPLLDGAYSMNVPDAVVIAFVDSGWFEPVPDRASRLRPTMAGSVALSRRPRSTAKGPPRAPATAPRQSRGNRRAA